MVVFAVVDFFPYQGEDFQAVFSSEEKARAYIDDRNKGGSTYQYVLYMCEVDNPARTEEIWYEGGD